jgi:hypothetical protein
MPATLMCAHVGFEYIGHEDFGSASLQSINSPLPQLHVTGLPAESVAVAPNALRSVHINPVGQGPGVALAEPAAPDTEPAVPTGEPAVPAGEPAIAMAPAVDMAPVPAAATAVPACGIAGAPAVVVGEPPAVVEGAGEPAVTGAAMPAVPAAVGGMVAGIIVVPIVRGTAALPPRGGGAPATPGGTITVLVTPGSPQATRLHKATQLTTTKPLTFAINLRRLSFALAADIRCITRLRPELP